MHYKKIFFSLLLSSLLFLFNYFFFRPIFISSSLIFPFSRVPFDLCEKYPFFWNIIKIIYLLCSYFSFFLFSYNLSRYILPNFSNSSDSSSSSIVSSPSELTLLIGNTPNQTPIFLSEKALYQNICIIGSIGSGKTSSAMYPFTQQLLSYESASKEKRLGMLILDTKGTYYQKVYDYAKQCHRESDIISIGMNSQETYNPLDKPNLNPIILANRLKTILLLFSPNNTESFWLDKVETVLAEAIKLCRFYNHNYVTFTEIHKLIMDSEYFSQKVMSLRNSFQKNMFNTSQSYNLFSCIQFFQKEFFSLDERTLSILKSEISRITNFFISDYKIQKTFCPSPSEITFYGFEDIIKNGKIVVLNMNIFEYKNLAKLIAAYLKLDFQSEVMQRLSHSSSNRPVCFICDEFHEYVTTSDSDFLAQSREAKCINIIATQSYTSLLHTLNNEAATKVILQNLVNKLCYRTDDIFTIETIQKQFGKEDKEKISKTISENAKETHYNYFTKSLLSKNTNLSESINTYYQTDYIYDAQFFTQSLETFTCLSFLSTGTKMLFPTKLNMIPYFQKGRDII